MIDFNSLNQRITILEHSVTVDRIGNHINEDTEFCKLWACVLYKNFAEKSESGVIENLQTVDFIVRNSQSLRRLNTTQFCIIFNNDIYDIIGISPYYDDKKYISIRATARKSGVRSEE